MIRRPFLAGLTVVAVIFLLGPIVIVAAVSVSDSAVVQFPPQGFTLDWFGEAVGRTAFREAFLTSLLVGAVATIAALIIGVPATYALYRGSGRGRLWLETLFMSPLVVPELVLGFALFQQFAIALGWDIITVLFLAHTILVLPYTVRVTGASLLQADPALEHAAAGLGAGPVRQFFSITIPVMMPGIIAATILSFLTSFNNLPLSLFLANRDWTTLPVSMLEYVEMHYTPTIAAVSVLLLIMTIGIAFLTERIAGFQKVFGKGAS